MGVGARCRLGVLRTGGAVRDGRGPKGVLRGPKGS
jgi:hypothetical protein